MSKIKMLALDLDGTLTNSEKIVTPRTVEALKKVMAQGICVVLASGRPPVGIEPLAVQLELAAHGGCILAYNGGEAVDCATGRILYQKPFPAEMITPVCSFAGEMDFAVICYDEKGVVTERPHDEWALTEARINKIPIHGVESLPEYLDKPVCKLLMTLAPEKMPAVEPEAHRRFDGKIDLVRSSPFFLEAMPLGVAKDTGLAALAAHKGILQSEVMACGDAMNDFSMVQWAGVGVVMANGDPAVKKAADYVTAADNDHDGVAEAIEKYILN